jgi:type I restriction enzyme, R subunit
MKKKALTEADIRTKFITPALDKDKQGSWDLMTQLLEEHYFTKGRVIVRGKTVHRGEAKKADYLLFYKPNIPIAVIEAKDYNHSVGAGMQQALDYAETLDLPFAYSSNGDAFLEHDRTPGANPVETELPLDACVWRIPKSRGDWELKKSAAILSPRIVTHICAWKAGFAVCNRR